MTDRQALGRRIGERCRLQGEFTLRSGQVSSTYFDKYLFESDPVLLGEVAREAAELIPEGTEFLAGWSLVVYQLSPLCHSSPDFRQCSFASRPRTTARRNWQRVGRSVVARPSWSRTSSRPVGRQLCRLGICGLEGAMVDTVLCIIDRSQGVHPEIVALGCSVVSVFTADNLG